MLISERDRDKAKERESAEKVGVEGAKRDLIILGVAGPQDPLSHKNKATNTPN